MGVTASAHKIKAEVTRQRKGKEGKGRLQLAYLTNNTYLGVAPHDGNTNLKLMLQFLARNVSPCSRQAIFLRYFILFFFFVMAGPRRLVSYIIALKPR